MTVAQVTFPLSGESAFTTAVEIRQAEYSHEIALVQLPNHQAGADFTQGTPLHAFWKDTKGTFGEWYGYVDTISQSVVSSNQASSAICVGTTYPLKEQRQDVWNNVTGDGIAETMAARWRLGVDIEGDSRLWDNIAQAGISDWALLAQLGHDMGYTLYSRGPLLCFHRRTREMVRLANAAPTFFYSAGAQDNDILAFSPTASDTVKGNNRVQSTIIDSTGLAMQLGNDDGSGTLLGSDDRLPNFTVIDTTTAQTADEAIYNLQAQAEDSRFSIHATATLRGDARLHPAMPLYLEGLPTQWNGLWFINSVTHQLSVQTDGQGQPDSYTCDVVLGRDGLGDSNALPTSANTYHTPDVVAEIGPNGLWQCGTIPNPPQEAPQPVFVTERLARNITFGTTATVTPIINVGSPTPAPPVPTPPPVGSVSAGLVANSTLSATGTKITIGPASANLVASASLMAAGSIITTGGPTNLLITVGARSGLPWNSGSQNVDQDSTNPPSYITSRNFMETGRGKLEDVIQSSQFMNDWVGLDGDLTCLKAMPTDCWAVIDTPPGWGNGARHSSWGAIAAGAADPHFYNMGVNYANYCWNSRNKHGVTLRLGWEANGSWYDWSAGRYDTNASYIAGWRYAAQQIRAGANSTGHGQMVVIDWSLSGLDTYWGNPLTTQYPGNDVVDTISLDFYDNTAGGGAISTSGFFGYGTMLNTFMAFAIANNKFMGITEWGLDHTGAGGTGGDNIYFIQGFYNWMRTANSSLGGLPNYTRVWAELYFQDDGVGNVQSSLWSPDVNNNPLGRAAYGPQLHP